MKYFTIFLFVLCFSIFSLKAQITCSADNCPTEDYTAGGPVRITINSCVYDVCYCSWVDEDDVVHLWMDPVINIVSGTGCFPFSGDDYAVLMKAFASHIIQLNPDGMDWPTCPPCTLVPPPPPPPTVFVVQHMSLCYYNGNPVGQTLGYDYCYSYYNVCCVNGVRTVTFDYYSAGSCSNPNYSVICE